MKADNSFLITKLKAGRSARLKYVVHFFFISLFIFWAFCSKQGKIRDKMKRILTELETLE